MKRGCVSTAPSRLDHKALPSSSRCSVPTMGVDLPRRDYCACSAVSPASRTLRACVRDVEAFSRRLCRRVLARPRPTSIHPPQPCDGVASSAVPARLRRRASCAVLPAGNTSRSHSQIGNSFQSRSAGSALLAPLVSVQRPAARFQPPWRRPQPVPRDGELSAQRNVRFPVCQLLRSLQNRLTRQARLRTAPYRNPRLHASFPCRRFSTTRPLDHHVHEISHDVSFNSR